MNSKPRFPAARLPGGLPETGLSAEFDPSAHHLLQDPFSRI
jgi:hypothetical protein